MATPFSSAKKFAAVLFVEDNAVDAVPLSWISSTDGKMMCAWPNGPSSAAAAEQRPVGKNWQQHEVKIIRKCGLLISTSYFSTFLQHRYISHHPIIHTYTSSFDQSY